MASVQQRVLVFGSSGTGKSSLINALGGHTYVKTSNSAVGVTSSVQPVFFSRAGVDYTFFDTPGLNEGTEGTVAAPKAWLNLMRLLKAGVDGGFSLVIMVHKGRILESFQHNYQLMCILLEGSGIPMILVQTGCEDDEGFDKFYETNKAHFAVYTNLRAVQGAYCGTTSAIKHLRVESTERVWDVIDAHARPSPVRLDASSYSTTFHQLWKFIVKIFKLPAKWEAISVTGLTITCKIVKILMLLGYTYAVARAEAVKSVDVYRKEGRAADEC